jgi:Ca-activated chloride channel homolog
MDAARQSVGKGAMTFARPDLLPLSFIVPLALALGVWLYARRRRRVAEAFSDPHLIGRLGGQELLRFPTARLVLLALAGASLAFAAAGPRWGVVAAEGRSSSLNIVIAADISRSMLAEDIEPNRLERARIFSRRLFRELPGDRFGLVVFAGRAYVLSPLTVDHSALDLYIDALDPAMVSEGGSSIAAAIAQATDLVRGSQPEAGDRIVILLSDGEALEDVEGVRSAADRAARAGVRVMTVGFGTPRGSTLPNIDPNTGIADGLIRDERGEVVVSRLDDQLLRDVAARANGSYFRVDDTGTLPRLVGELRGMQRGVGDSATRVEPRERFAIFVLLGVLLLVLDTLVGSAGRQAAREGIAAAAAPRRATPGRPTGRPTGSSMARPAGRAPGRRGRTAALLVLAALGLGFGIGDLERGNRMYREGRYDEAVHAYQRVLEAGKATPQLHYNLGTALLALGRYDDAGQHFRAALDDVDPELRQRAFYNMGNRFLQEARAEVDLPRQGQLLDAAIEAYRRTLRLAPGDTRAKWNLEMALRERDENEEQQQNMPQQSEQQSDADQDPQQAEGGGTGGGAGQTDPGSGADAGAADQQPMSQEQADQILSSLEQDERDLTRDKLRRGQRRTPVLRDW